MRLFFLLLIYAWLWESHPLIFLGLVAIFLALFFSPASSSQARTNSDQP